jgi:hypothetical protein
MAFIGVHSELAFKSKTNWFTACFSVVLNVPPAVVTLPKKATASASNDAICDAINP